VPALSPPLVLIAEGDSGNWRDVRAGNGVGPLHSNEKHNSQKQSEKCSCIERPRPLCDSSLFSHGLTLLPLDFGPTEDAEPAVRKKTFSRTLNRYFFI
jgi:hypothetical protein